MKKLLWVVCIVLMIVIGTTTAMAAETEQEALSYEELMDFVQPYEEMARKTKPLNYPVTDEALTDDGYAYIYEDATLFFDKAELEKDAKLNAIVIVSEEAKLPRDVNIDAPFEALIDAFYSENDDLTGTFDFAYLYISDTMPMGAMWAWVQRSGQQPTAVQYAVHEQLSSGGEGYTDCGLLYTIQANTVVAMRVYGLNGVKTEEEVKADIEQVAQVARDTSYHMYKKSNTGDDVTPFDMADLTFSGIHYPTVTPEQAIAAFGEPIEDVWMEDGETGHLRTMSFNDAMLVYGFDMEKKNGTILFMDITSAELEGPRGTCVGEAFSDVLQRFMHSQGEYDGTGTEQLYGKEGDKQFATAEYEDGGNATLRYTVMNDDGSYVCLQMSFLEDVLSEIMIYNW